MATLPTFFVIGAAKCGTTSLHTYLGAHPEVEMTSIKEPQVFADDTGARAAEERYSELLSGDARERGESSAVYTQYPRWDGVPGRIAACVPDARFVYLVRDPIDRAVAHYRQHVADGKEKRPLAEALADWERHDSLYLCPSRYATQLQQYLEVFDASRILVVDREDLLERRTDALHRVFAFLEVDDAFTAPAFELELNIGGAQRAPTALGARLRRNPLFEAMRRAPLPAPIRRGLRRIASRPIAESGLDPSVRARLEESLRDEIAWLRSFTGYPFASWSL